MLLALSNALVIRRDGNNAEDTPTFKCFEFDSQTGSLPAERKRRRRLVHSIAVSPNAKFIASGSWDHQGETPKRPDQALVTLRRWTFIERCRASVESRPDHDEIVEFTMNELIQVVLCRF
ncbi:hypothetical protein PAXINDRAFT_19422 [Paxillus involutus ATCC 200175]|uniref:Uncharacterized protein n=1 Tax=Paxillus involutus ATCC 200175 TaxID=664439 RepID=A0A0C9SN65_PAXIN|nr:hypothetical protein PAXINDRAFT_19422 [Paxillus involutus ATCC 200175]